MSLEFQLPLLFDQTDPSLSAYLNDDYIVNDQPIDFLTSTFTTDEFADRLLNQLNVDNEMEQGIHRQFVNDASDNILNPSSKQEDFLRFLDELDIPMDDSNLQQTGQISPIEFSDQTDVCVVDEHDYATKGITRQSRHSFSSSSVDEGTNGSSEERSSIEFERQITSNSSSSSGSFDFRVPCVTGRDLEVINISDSDYQQPVQKQRRYVLPLPPLRKPETDPAMKRKYPPVILTEEERQLCEKERLHLPSHFPLTKDEERKLRAIRRKIRNKASAQQSRRKKEEYIKALEDRAAICTEENERLQQQVRELTKSNSQLQTQLRKLKDTLINSGRRSAQSTSCLAVLLLSFALLIAPEYGPFGKRSEKSSPAASNVDDVSTVITPGNTRTLLQLQGPLESDFTNEDDSPFGPFYDGYLYSNESIKIDDQLPISKKRKLALMPPDGDAFTDYGMKKKPALDFGIPTPPETTIELEFYRTPGTAAINGSPEINYRRTSMTMLSSNK